MAYDANEDSVQDGTPFECFEFVGPVGTYRYVTLPFNVTLDGKTFTSETIKRSSADISAVLDDLKTIDVHLPFSNALATLYAQANLPDYLTVTIYRAHYGDDLSTEFNIEWVGSSDGYEINDNEFIIKTKSVLQALLQGEMRSIKYQAACNNRVYDAVCGLNESLFTYNATVTRVNLTQVTVDDDQVADNGLVLGKMTLARTGEVRQIITNTDVDSGGSRIKVAYPFQDLVVGDTVQLTLGCDNTRDTCVTRFNNLDQFTGFPYIPIKNPFGGG